MEYDMMSQIIAAGVVLISARAFLKLDENGLHTTLNAIPGVGLFCVRDELLAKRRQASSDRRVVRKVRTGLPR
jgi:hypothetical protein